MIDYAGVIADLEDKREAIGEVLAGFRRLAGTVPGTATPVPPHRRLPHPAAARHAAKRPHPAPRKAPKTPVKVTPSKATPPHAATAPALRRPHHGRQGPRSRLTAEQVAHARAIAEKRGMPAAVAATGLKYKTLWNWSRRQGWKVPRSPHGPRQPTAKKPASSIASSSAVPAPREGTPTPLRVCTQCERRVTVDPCPHCGTAWHRTAS